MGDEWIQGRFEGVYTGERTDSSPADPEGSRRFGFEIVSGEIRDLELIPAPLETDAPGEQKQIRQERVKRVRLPLLHGDEDGNGDEAAIRERPLFDVRIRDWQLKHPAEKKGRSFGTIVGTVEACLSPPIADLEPMRVAAPPPPPRDVDRAAPTREQAKPRRLTSAARPSRSEAVEGTDAEVVYGRLRWLLGILLWMAGCAAFAWGCGASAALAWGGPVAAAMAVRAITGGFDVGPRRLHRWLGVAVLLGAAVAWSEPMLAWWRADCGAAALPSMPWLAAPVVVAALLRVRWPLLAASLGWAGMVCATCWQLDGACAGALPTETAPEPIAAVSPEVPDAASLAPPRTDSGGRWPAPPSPSSVGVSLSKLADRMAAAAGGTGRAAPGSPAAVPGRSGGPSGAGPGSVPDASASGGSSDGAPVLPEGRGAAASPSPAAPVVPQPGSGRPGEAVAEPPVPESPRRFAGPQSTRGGWVSADHRRTPRDHVRISVEHATRSPDDFFGEARRRVYIPSDRVFDPGTTRIRKKGELELARLANLMKLQPDRRGVLEVHTDASGSPADQEALSGRQAAAIHDWLASRGHLDPDRLELRGAGGSEPIVPPDGSHAAQKPNRRIEIHLID